MVDILGNKEEKIEQLESKYRDLGKQVDAVDSALQETTQQIRNELQTEAQAQREQLQTLRKTARSSANEQEVDQLRKRLEVVEKAMLKRTDMMEELDNAINDLTHQISEISQNVKETRKKSQSLEERFDRLESEVLVEQNNEQMDYERKLDKTEFQNKHKKLEDEISKLRTSLNIIAEETGKKDDIQSK